MSIQSRGGEIRFLGLGLFCLVVMQGCLATREWVTQQIAPVDSRVTEVEGRVADVEGQVADVDTRLGQTNVRVDELAMRLDNLHLERRFVLNLKEGATFALNSAMLTEEARQQVDGFLTDLQETEGLIFLVAGHTDSSGPEDYNYELGQNRAASVAQYLIAQRGVDPTRVSAVSYGESMPLADNSTQWGRHQNRRVEILVYKDTLSTAPVQEGTTSRTETLSY